MIPNQINDPNSISFDTIFFAMIPTIHSLIFKVRTCLQNVCFSVFIDTSMRHARIAKNSLPTSSYNKIHDIKCQMVLSIIICFLLISFYPFLFLSLSNCNAKDVRKTPKPIIIIIICKQIESFTFHVHCGLLLFDFHFFGLNFLFFRGKKHELTAI